MEFSGQFHALAALSRSKEPLEAGWAPYPALIRWRREKCHHYPLRESNLGRPARSLVSVFARGFLTMNCSEVMQLLFYYSQWMLVPLTKFLLICSDVLNGRYSIPFLWLCHWFGYYQCLELNSGQLQNVHNIKIMISVFLETGFLEYQFSSIILSPTNCFRNNKSIP
jgi:hypothetical protein